MHGFKDDPMFFFVMTWSVYFNFLGLGYSQSNNSVATFGALSLYQTLPKLYEKGRRNGIRKLVIAIRRWLIIRDGGGLLTVYCTCTQIFMITFIYSLAWKLLVVLLIYDRLVVHLSIEGVSLFTSIRYVHWTFRE